MGFKRSVLAPPTPSSGELTRDMVGIGMLFGGEGSKAPNIENTLLFASRVGVDGEDFRVLAVLCTWVGVHARGVNADRLVSLTSGDPSQRVRSFWAAIGHWQGKDRRFAKLKKLHKGQSMALLESGQDFQIRRLGEDARFVGSGLRVDAKILRDRPGDVLTPAELARAHPTYRYRRMMGPSYRADIWAQLELEPQLGASELARRAYASVGAAWEVRRDFASLR